MPAYSVAEAKNTLPRLIDKAIAGEEVVITRHGKPVVELRPAPPRQTRRSPEAFRRLIEATRRRKGVGITSVELLRQMHEDEH